MPSYGIIKILLILLAIVPSIALAYFAIAAETENAGQKTEE